MGETSFLKRLMAAGIINKAQHGCFGHLHGSFVFLSCPRIGAPYVTARHRVE
jgi:hypothetical protein